MRYFDLHADTPRACFKRDVTPDYNSLAASVKKGDVLDCWYQCFAVFVPDGSADPILEYESVISDFKRKTSVFNKPKYCFTLENALPINSIDFVSRLAADNVKAVTLTWNGANHIAGGVDSVSGLTPFGKEVINALNGFNIAVDLSHLNRRSFFEAGEVAKNIFASHTCCYKTHRHPRNLTDEQLRYIAERGGVIGLCFYPEFLGTKYAFEGVWRHINHLLNLGLHENIAFGSDFDGADMADCLDGVDKIPALYRFLQSRGLSAELLDALFFKNACDFLKNFDKTVLL